MATIYSSYMDTSGGKNFLRAYLTYSVTVNNAETYTISASSGCNVKSGWYTNAKLTNVLSCTGHNNDSATVNNKNWKAGNHQMLGARSLSTTKTHSAQTIKLTSKLSSSVDSASVTATFTVPARASYTVTLNNNGSISTKTKWYKENLVLGTPTRTGYSFDGWTNQDGTATPITTYTGNAAATFYAKWTKIFITQNFDANGGSFVGDAPQESIEYEANLDFSEIEHPTRSGYVFTGWSLVPNQTVGEHWSDSLSITNTSTATWYACWTEEYIPPGIDADKIRSFRGTVINNVWSDDDAGTFGTITATFRKGQRVSYNGQSFIYTDIDINNAEVLSSPTSGQFTIKQLSNDSNIVTAVTNAVSSDPPTGPLDTVNSYQLTLRLYDSYTGASTPAVTAVSTISSAFFTMDVSRDGKCVAFGDVADDDVPNDNGLLKVKMDAQFLGSLTDGDGNRILANAKIKLPSAKKYWEVSNWNTAARSFKYLSAFTTSTNSNQISDDSVFDGGIDGFICKKAGWYYFYAYAHFNTSVDGTNCYLRIYDYTNSTTITYDQYITTTLTYGSKSIGAVYYVPNDNSTIAVQFAKYTNNTTTNWRPTNGGFGAIALEGTVTPITEELPESVSEAQISTFSSGWAQYDTGAGNEVWVRKYGRVCTLTGRLKNTAAKTLNTTIQQVFTIPVGFRPIQNMISIHQGSGTAKWEMDVNTDGAVYFARYTDAKDSYPSIAVGSWFPFHITYITAD